MNRITCIIISFLLITHLAKAQDAPNKLDENGKKQGHWIKYDENKKKIYDGNFVDDIPFGKFTYYYETGLLKAINLFSQNGTVSRAQLYDSGGKLSGEGKYVNQKRDSIWKFYNIDGKVISDENYVNGLKNGKFRVFYASGELAEEKTWANGKLNGEVKKYFENGQLKYYGHVIDDKVEGKTTYYYSTGKIEAEGMYMADLKEGEWKYYEENGKVKRVDKYINGRNTEPDKDVIPQAELEKAKKKYENSEIKDPFKEPQE